MKAWPHLLPPPPHASKFLGNQCPCCLAKTLAAAAENGQWVWTGPPRHKDGKAASEELRRAGYTGIYGPRTT